ncbi:hypothetical protein SRB5_24440 [Streptomyces sp. RB5]|uniref:Integral membrane protein n=1 Tax=Streptomyces smaragdinus TaxID=2585196 RepID=A0A7K0CFQ9_9ACTN|nr:hypothetical protein [Streptomyces smaragdinus]MQY12311.1 hypothetical protein [Streptomyces smaragdinus]
MSGPLWLVPDGCSEALPQLDGTLLDVCAAAVHPDEIAAVLESEGLTDEQVRELYGHPSVFELAAELYERSPRSHPEPPPAPDPWRTDAWRCLLRGVLFALPGLGYVLGARLLPTGEPDVFGLPAGGALLAVSVLFGWAWNQALAHRAYVLLGSGDGGRAAAARCLLTGAVLGALAVAVPALAVPGKAAAGLFAAGQSCYLGAATVLLVLGGERLLLAALAPTVLGAALLAVAGVPDTAAAVLLTATVALAVLSAGGVAGRALVEEWAARPRAERAVTVRLVPSPPAAACLPYGLFGLAAGLLTLTTAVGGILRHGPGTPLAGTATLALTLGMGGAEWLLYQVRGRALTTLRRCRTPLGFRAAAAGVLLTALAAYLALLAALGLVLRQPPGPLLALGAVLWLALLLQALGTAWPPALICAGAAALELALLGTDTAGPATAQLTVAGGAGVVLLALATAVLGRATAHR